MTWTRVQQAQGGSMATGGSGSSIAATFGAGVGVGNLVVGWVFFGITPSLSSVTDGTNTYVVPQNAATTLLQASWFYGLNIQGGVTTITANFSVNTLVHAIQVVEYSNSGGAASAVFAASNSGFQNTPGAGTDAITSGSFTSLLPGSLIWGACGNSFNTGHSVSVAGTGYTSGTQFGAQAGLDEYQTQAAAGAIAATFTDATNGTTDSYLTGGMAFSPPSANLVMMQARPMFGF